MEIKKYYPCPLCPRGQFPLKHIYMTDQMKDLYRGECDRCKATFDILIPISQPMQVRDDNETIKDNKEKVYD